MKFTCPKQALANAVSTVSKALATQPQTPILSGIFLKTEEGALSLQATDYEIGILEKLPVDIEEPGEVILQGRYFLDLIRHLPGDTVRFHYNPSDRIAHIQSESINYTLRSMTGEYPSVKRFEGNLHFTLPDTMLRALFRKTVFACSTDPSRPVFTGVHVNIDGKTITLASTNTHRLAVKKQTLPQELGSIKLIIPAKTLQELLHILTSNVPTDVEVTCSMNQISFQYENIYFTSRLIEGAFPSFENVIPKNPTTTVTMTTADLVAAMDRVYLISRANQYNNVKLHFSDNNLHIFASNPDIGIAEEDIPATIVGPDLTIIFNEAYLLDALKSLDGETCEFALKTPLTPVLITDAKDPDFLYVATPMRTQN